MNQIKFLVQSSSSDENYEVMFTKSSEKLSVSCTCTAAEHSQQCKHRLGLLDGNPTGIMSDNADDLDTVQKWLKGTPLEKAYHTLQRAIESEQKAKKELATAKRVIGRVMEG